LENESHGLVIEGVSDPDLIVKGAILLLFEV